MPQPQPLWTDVLNSISGAISAAGALITAFTAAIVAYIAWNKYIKEETRTSTPNRLVIFDWEKQTAELRATEKGLEYHLFDIRPTHEKEITWDIPADELPDIKISVEPSRDYPKWGLFSLGRKMNWYFSWKLFKNDEAVFRKSIEDLIKRSLDMAKGSA